MPMQISSATLPSGVKQQHHLVAFVFVFPPTFCALSPACGRMTPAYGGTAAVSHIDPYVMAKRKLLPGRESLIYRETML